MENAICRCCCNPKRPVRFTTPRIAICQWCITSINSACVTAKELIQNGLSDRLEAMRRSINADIDALQASRQPYPIYQPTDDETVRQRALVAAKAEESLFVSWARTVFGSTQRIIRVAELGEVLRKQYLEGFAELLNRYKADEQRIDEEIAALKANRQSFKKIALEKTLAELWPKPPLTITKNGNVKLIRAVWLGIATMEGGSTPRLFTDEYHALRKKVLKQDRYRCALCNRTWKERELHVHHIIHLAHGGANKERNLVTLCIPCHGKQHPDIRIAGGRPRRTNQLLRSP